MRLISFKKNNEVSYGVKADNGIIDLKKQFGDRFPDLRSAISGNAFDEIRDWAEGRPVDHSFQDIQYLPVITNPDKILCIGLNYVMHQKETKREPTDYPVIFTRFSNTQVGHGEPILVPRESVKLDYEGELAVVIGRGGRRVKEENAFDHIAGYACYNDASVRDWQFHTHQYTPGKNYFATGGFGPELVTTNEIPDVTALTLTTRLNGEEMQCAKIDQMIFNIAEQIAYISTFTPLVSGDIIVTGTPGGVGAKRNPPVWMRDGDVCEVEITNIGTLRNPIASE